MSAERLEVYEPPMLDEVGGFTALTRADAAGSIVDGSGYFPQ
ncbi:MAG: lasso RiPP family leader peptide-containing protein [Pseudonocardiaceae bacterium]